MTKKVLAIGGCHILGFCCDDAADGFVHQVSRALWDSNYAVSQTFQVSIKAAPATLISLKDREFDLILFQLGHFETSVPLARFSASPDVNRGNRSDYPPQATYFQKIILPWMKSPIKIIRLIRLFMSGHKHVNIRNMRSNIDKLFYAIDKSCLKSKIIVLRTFPSTDPIINFHRLIVDRMLRGRCREHGVPFIDARRGFFDGVMVPTPFLLPGAFWDVIHLSGDGHARVARAIIDELARLPASQEITLESVARRAPIPRSGSASDGDR